MIYGYEIWSPLDLLGAFLDNDDSSATRAGVFFIALAFALAQLGVNVSLYSMPRLAGTNLFRLLPTLSLLDLI